MSADATIGYTELLTAAGVFVAILSALYAARSAASARRQADSAEASLKEARAQSSLARGALSEAKTQSNIAMHASMLAAYKALLAFSADVTQRGHKFRNEATWELWEHARIAEFYFSSPTAQALTTIVDLSINAQISREEWDQANDPDDPNARSISVERTFALMKKIRVSVEVADELMRNELRLKKSDG